MQIVCGEHSLVEQPEQYSSEKEIVLEIEEIINHEGYSPGELNGERKGPYLGKDIAAYKINSENFNRKEGTVYPACLPRPSYTTEPGIFAAWLDPEPI